MSERHYSIDTSAILDGHIRYYSPDVFPGIWSRLGALIDAGRLFAPDIVIDELKKKLDEAHRWAKGHSRLAVPLEKDVQLAATEVVNQYPKLIDNRPGRDAAADPFVIGLARARGLTVVTGERETGSLGRPNIPDVCKALKVPCFSMLDLFRHEAWKLV